MSLDKRIVLTPLNQKQKANANKKLQTKKEFYLDCTSQNVKLPSYQPFRDKHLENFLHNSVIKKHLTKIGVMNEKGVFYNEKEFSFLTRQSPQHERVDLDNLKKNKFILLSKKQTTRLPKLPKLVSHQIYNEKTRNNTTDNSRYEEPLKPINKEEFQKFMSLYKKEYA